MPKKPVDTQGVIQTAVEGLHSASVDMIGTQQSSELDLMTIGYWPAHDQLLLGERGHGRVWQLDLAQIRPLPYFNFQIFIPIIAN